MIAILILAGVLAGASLIGWAVHRTVFRLRNRGSRWVLSVFVAIAVFVLAGLVLVVFGFSLPASDDSKFADRELAVRFDDPTTGETTKIGAIQLIAPSNMRVNDDQTVRLLISDFFSYAPSGAEATLDAGKGVDVRTLEPCTGSTSAGSNATTSVCARDTTGEGFRWITHSAREGRVLAIVRLPAGLVTAISARKDNWRALVIDGGWPLQVLTRNGKTKVGSYELRDFGSEDLLLSAKRPAVQYGDIAVDLHTGTIMYPLEIETTLGVSAATYSWITLIGAILSAMVGGGWLWQVRSWQKEQREETARPPRRRSTRRRNQ